MFREKIKAHFTSGDDGGSADSIEPPYPPPSNESQWVAKRIVSKCVSII